MPDLDIDSTQPLTIDTTLDAALRINVEFFYKLNGEKKWRSFFTAQLGSEIPSQVFTTHLDPVSQGSAVLLTMVFFGATKSAYRGSFKFSQNGTSVGAQLKLQGSTGAKYASYKEVEVTLV